MIQDSGARREFESGAVRDIQEGKGRCDLLPLGMCAELLNCDRGHDTAPLDTLMLIDEYMRTGNANMLCLGVCHFITYEWKLDIYTALIEVSKHYEEGCKKYGERNWQKGIPLHCYIDSGVRHYLKFLRGDTDERHDRAFVWNMLGLLWTAMHKPELDDIHESVTPEN